MRPRAWNAPKASSTWDILHAWQHFKGGDSLEGGRFTACADSREHAYAMTRKRARRKEREALGRRSSRRTTREPDRLIANSINLMPTTLMAQREELNYYLDNDEIGQLVKEVLATTNIYG